MRAWPIICRHIHIFDADRFEFARVSRVCFVGCACGAQVSQSNIAMAEKLWEAGAVDQYFLAKNDEMLERSVFIRATSMHDREIAYIITRRLRAQDAAAHPGGFGAGLRAGRDLVLALLAATGAPPQPGGTLVFFLSSFLSFFCLLCCFLRMHD